MANSLSDNLLLPWCVNHMYECIFTLYNASIKSMYTYSKYRITYITKGDQVSCRSYVFLTGSLLKKAILPGYN